MIDRLSQLALLPALLVASSAPGLDDELPSRDRKKLVRAAADYYEAEAEGDSISEARQELAEAMTELEEDLDAPLLSYVEALQGIWTEARERSSRVDGRGRPEEIEVTFGDFETKAVVRAPKSYKGSDELYPLVMVVPEPGQTPEEALAFDWSQPSAVDEGVFCAVSMPADEADWVGFGDGTPGGIYHVMPTLGKMISEYSIDPDRIVIAGRGLGVAAAAEVAATFPDRFAAVVGIAGDLEESQTPHNFAAIETLWIGGGANASNFVDAAKAMGRENARSEPNLEPDEIWTWVAERERVAHPKQLMFRPRDERAGDAYWIAARGIGIDDPETGLEATVDTESNTISIEGKGISSVILRFNDELVDLSKPVRVVLNGVEHERSFERNLLLMLGRLKASNDPGRLYMAQAEFDFEASAE